MERMPAKREVPRQSARGKTRFDREGNAQATGAKSEMASTGYKCEKGAGSGISQEPQSQSRLVSWMYERATRSTVKRNSG